VIPLMGAADFSFFWHPFLIADGLIAVTVGASMALQTVVTRPGRLRIGRDVACEGLLARQEKNAGLR